MNKNTKLPKSIYLCFFLEVFFLMGIIMQPEVAPILAIFMLFIAAYTVKKGKEIMRKEEEAKFLGEGGGKPVCV